MAKGLAGSDFGAIGAGTVKYAVVKLRTKYGKQNVAVVENTGVDYSCTENRLYVKHKGKVYYYGSKGIDGILKAVSKDRKYFYTYMGISYGAEIYKYNQKKGKYVLLKSDTTGSESATNKIVNEAKKKYGCVVPVKEKSWKYVKAK